jgi:GTP 3',8-cyclase
MVGPVIHDRHHRPLSNLRLSVTDRCNLRCSYCMPEADYVWLPREDILQFEEIERLLDVFLTLGVSKVRLTGGEPLLRRTCLSSCSRSRRGPPCDDLALTTNGVLLSAHAAALRTAGLHRLTVSLDTLRRDRFPAGSPATTSSIASWQGIDTAAPLFPGLKIDTVVIRGVNDDELIALLEFGPRPTAQKCGSSSTWTWAAPRTGRWTHVVTRAEILRRSQPRYGAVPSRWTRSRLRAGRSLPLQDGTVFGIISSTTEPFCRSCDRSRLTADGMWYLCLYATRRAPTFEPHCARGCRPTPSPT